MRLFVLSCALALLPVAAGAQDVVLVGPVFSQLVAFPLPEGFAPAFEDASATAYLHESVLQGETVQDWTQMITLSGSKALASDDPGYDAATTAAYLANLYSRACPDSFAAAEFDPPAIPGAKAVHAGYLSCGSTMDGPVSESMVFLVLVGAADVYTLQWAEHGPGSATPMAYPGDVWDQRLQTLTAQTRICDRVKGEAAPYPSCTGT